jgi:hypothetical protein
LISGATTATYTLVAADAGKYVSVKVTAINSMGSASRWSASTVDVAGLPVNAIAPLVTGTATASQVLTVSNGTWSESPTTFTYQWLRCTAVQIAANAAPGECTPISGATANTYTLTVADAAGFIVAAVTATNANGSVGKWSASTVAVDALLSPVNTSEPKLLGKAEIDGSLTLAIGLWSGSPTSYSYQWFACDEAMTASSELSDSCYELEFETSWGYVPDESDAGKYLLAEVTARNSTGSTTTYSATSAMVPGLPVLLNPPEIRGTSLVGESLGVDEGYWDYWNEFDHETDYQWLRCDQASEFSLEFPDSCEPIMFENNSEYWVTDKDEGNYIVVAVTASNNIGSAVAYSASTSMVEYGLLVSGYVSTDNTGDPVPFATISFQNLNNWRQSGSAYTDEYGYFEVTLNSGDYVVSLNSQIDDLVSGPLPSGSWELADVYSITDESELNLAVQRSGSVTGCIYGAYSEEYYGIYAWQLGTTGGLGLWQQSLDGNWVQVASQEDGFGFRLPSIGDMDPRLCLEYTLDGVAPGAYKMFVGDPGEQEPLHERMWYGNATTPELGEWIVVESGEETILSDVELTLNPGAPLSKAPVVTRTVTADDGVRLSWTKPQSVSPILGYQGQSQCGYAGDGWIMMGADSLEIDLASYIGTYYSPTVCSFTVQAITTSGHGYTGITTWSDGTTTQGPDLTVFDVTATGFNVIAEAVAAGANSYWAILSGEGVDRDQASIIGHLTEEEGLHSIGDPYAIEYTGLVPGKTYTLSVASRHDFDGFTNWKTMTVTLRNAPTNTVAPVITGTARVANPLTVSAGTWTDSPTSFTYDWLRCREASTVSIVKPATCVSPYSMDESEFFTSYPLGKEDAGYFMVAAVSAENEYGVATVYTASTQAIAGLPVNTVAPALTGTARYKQTLTASRGTWIESPIAYTYQWYKCEESSVVASVKPGTCELVPGARSSRYPTKVKDLGYFFVAAVTARNSIGSATRWSASSLAVAGLPVNTVAPTVSGEARIGSEMTLSIGTWTESPTSYAYQWFQCDEATTVSSVEPDACYAIDGATSWRYEVDVADAGMFLVAEVTARNALGSAVRYSASSAEVAGLPVPVIPPEIYGAPITDLSLSVGTGSWSEEPSEFDYQWLRCTNVSEATSSFPESCDPILFETESHYFVQDSDEGMFIVAAITAINGVGSRVTYTASTGEIDYGVLVFGQVSAADTGEAVAFTSLNFQNVGNWRSSGFASTDEFGYFETRLSAGDYRISLDTQDETLVDGFLPNGNWDLADVYSISEDGELNLTVQRAGAVTGSIVSSVDGGLTGDATVSLWTQSPNGSWVQTGWYEFIDEPGLFTFSGVAPGTYKMFFGQAWNATRPLQMGWYGNASTPESSPDIVVTSGEILDLSAVTLSPVTASPPAAAPTVTTVLLPSGDIRISWTKPTSNSPVLGYNLGIGCGWSGDGLTVMGADTLEVVLGWWTVPGRSQACVASVVPFTTNGDGYRGSAIWSSNTSIEGPALTVSNVTSSGFSVTAQTRSSDGDAYAFLVSGEVPIGNRAGEVTGDLEPGAPFTDTYAGLIPGKTYTVSVTSRYGTNYDMSGWSTTTVTLPLVAARSQIRARR